MKRLLFLILLFCGGSLAHSALAADIFVSPEAQATVADGSVEHPFATISEALKEARSWRRLHDVRCNGGIRIVLRGGIYRLREPLFVRPEDSGTALSPTTVCSYTGERVVISGAEALKGWQKSMEKPNIYTANTPRQGRRPAILRQIYTEGGFALRSFQFPKDSMRRIVDFSPQTRTITIPTPKTVFKMDDMPEMLVHQRWATAILRIDEMRDNGDGTTTVSFFDPESRLEFSHPWPQPIIKGEKGSSSFALMNAMDFLDENMEWFQDERQGTVSMYFANGDTPENHQFEAPLLSTLLRIWGAKAREVSHFHFKDIAFEHTAWIKPSLQGHVTLQGGMALLDAYKLKVAGVPDKAELENQAWIERPEAAIDVQYANNISFTGCTFRCLASTGLDLRECVSSSTVSNCTFTDIGGTALLLGTFPDRGFETHVPLRKENADFLCHNILIKGNHIERASQEDWGAVGIAAGYVRDTDIEANLVECVNYSGICLGWGWTSLATEMRNNHITGNIVRDYARQLYDAGGIYTLSLQPNSTIQRNTVSKPHNAPYATNERAFAIYFDERTDGFLVEDNDMDSLSFGYNQPGKRMTIRNNSKK